MTDNSPFLVVAIGDFNARSSSWQINDKINCEGIDYLATQYDLRHIINKPNRLLDNSSSCFDLIFTFQPDLVMNAVINAGFHPSLQTYCCHQMVYAKFDSKIHYPRPYEREVQHFQKADINLIRKAIIKGFFSLDNNEEVSVCNTTIKNIIENFIPHEMIICDYKDPPWINNKIKKKKFTIESISIMSIAKIIILVFWKINALAEEVPYGYEGIEAYFTQIYSYFTKIVLK